MKHQCLLLICVAAAACDSRATASGAGEVGFEGFVHHVVYDGARGVEGAGLLTCGGARLRVVGGQQILEGLDEGEQDTL